MAEWPRLSVLARAVPELLPRLFCGEGRELRPYSWPAVLSPLPTGPPPFDLEGVLIESIPAEFLLKVGEPSLKYQKN